MTSSEWRVASFEETPHSSPTDPPTFLQNLTHTTGLDSQPGLGTRYSELATRYSLLATRYSSLVTRHYYVFRRLKPSK